jgi:hypothetical protein
VKAKKVHMDSCERESLDGVAEKYANTTAECNSCNQFPCRQYERIACSSDAKDSYLLKFIHVRALNHRRNDLHNYLSFFKLYMTNGVN